MDGLFLIYINYSSKFNQRHKINKFFNLNKRFTELQDEIKFTKDKCENLEEASNELILTDEEVVRFQISEVFAHVSIDEVETRLEEEKDSVVSRMAELKKILYAKFGDSIKT